MEDQTTIVFTHEQDEDHNYVVGFKSYKGREAITFRQMWDVDGNGKYKWTKIGVDFPVKHARAIAEAILAQLGDAPTVKVAKSKATAKSEPMAATVPPATNNGPKQRACSNCGQLGHRATTCGRQAAATVAPTVVSQPVTNGKRPRSAKQLANDARLRSKGKAQFAPQTAATVPPASNGKDKVCDGCKQSFHKLATVVKFGQEFHVCHSCKNS